MNAMIEQQIMEIGEATAWIGVCDKSVDNINKYIEMVDEKLSRICMEVEDIESARKGKKGNR